MAKADEKDTKKKAAAKPAAAKKTVAAKTVEAKPAAKPAAKKAEAKPAATKRVVARPVTRVTRTTEPERPRAKAEERPKREKVARALPTAPAGQAPLIGADGSPSGSIALPSVLAKPVRHTATMFQAFLAARANARQATAATKNRARVSGGGRKPYAQKGTGRARQGSIRAPHFRHGGVVFGPNGRRYEQRMPERMRRAAFAEAFSERAAAGRVFVFDELRLEGERARTRDVAQWLGKIGDIGRTMVVSPAIDERVGRAVANIPGIEIRTPGSLRLTDVLSADTLLVMRPTLDALAARATARHHAEAKA